MQEVQRLFLRNAGLLRGFILGLLPDHNLAEDVFQDVFLTAVAKADDFRDGSNFLAWVRAIARLKVLEQCRKQKAGPHLLDPAALEAVVAAAADLDNAWESRREALAYCIKRLSPRARQILELRYSEEFLPPRASRSSCAGASAPSTSRCRGRGSSFKNAPGAASRCGRSSVDQGRLHELLESYLENRLSDADRADLGRELASSRTACRAFWDCVEQHALVGELLAEQRGYAMALRERPLGVGPKPRRIGRRLAVTAAVAAAAAVVIAAAWGLFGPGDRRASPASATHNPVIARLEEAEGEVYVVSGAGRILAEPGQDLFAGHEIQSGEGGFAVVRYPDATRLELGADSTLRLSSAADALGKKVFLTQGVVMADVAQQPEGRPLVMATPFAEVRGLAARFLTAITPGATRVELEDGQLQMSPMNAGPPVQMAAGSYAVAGAAGGPTAPRPLPMRLTEDKAAIRLGKAIQASAFSADGGLFASAVGDGVVKVWDAPSRQVRSVLALPSLGVTVLAFSADGKMLAAACPDKPAKQARIVVWDLDTGEQRAGFTGLPDVSALAFSPDGRRVAVGGADGKHAPDVLLWDLASNSSQPLPPQAIPQGNKWRGAASLAFSPDGGLLAVGGRDGVVRLIDLAGGKEMVLLKGHTDAVACVAFSPDGGTLASGGKGKDRSVRLWDVTGRREEAALPSPSGAVFCVCFSPDGQTVAAGCDGGVGRLWDAVGGVEKAAVQGHKRPVLRVAFSADGRTLETAGRDGMVKFWMVDEGEDVN